MTSEGGQSGTRPTAQMRSQTTRHLDLFTTVAHLDGRKPEATGQDTAFRVVMLGQYFYPENAGTAQVLTDLARALQSERMQISAVTGQPTYERSRWLRSHEVYDGIRIVRLPVPYLGRRVLAARALSALMYVGLALWRVLLARDDAVLLLVTNPPFLPWAGWILKKLRGRRYVCLVQDMYPDILVALEYLKPTGFVASIWDRVNKRVYLDADAVVVLGDRMAERLRQKLGADANRIRLEVIHNWADPDVVAPMDKDDNWFRRTHGLTNKLVVLYSGNIGLFHDVETLLEAADRLRGDDRCVFVFVGDGGKAPTVERYVRVRGLTNVLILPYQPRDRLPDSLTCGDVAAVTLARGMEGLCVPGKLYTGLAAGQAILAVVGEKSEVADIVQRYRCGVRVDQGDAQGVVDALRRWQEDPALLEEMQHNARQCFVERFTRGQAVQQYADLLRSVAVADSGA